MGGEDQTGLSVQSDHDIHNSTYDEPDKFRVKTEENDADRQLALEKETGSTRSSARGSRTGSPTRKVISFNDGDPENPHNWGTSKKVYCISAAILTVMNSTTSSSLASGISKQLTQRFHLHNQAELVLPTSIYLVGYTVGPLIFGPLSESYGRRLIMIVAFSIFTVFSMASALAPHWPALIIFRLFVGIAGACPIAVVGGIFADLYADPTIRGRGMAIFMAATVFGPLFGPIASGYTGSISWRWPFWIGLILAGVTWPILLLMPETFAPVIIKKRARKLRHETGDQNIVAPIELEQKELRHIITIVLTRPFRMFLFEAIVLFSCLYLSLGYSIFYIFFQSYPIIYQGIYGFTPGQMGLTFLPIGVGAVIACIIYIMWDRTMHKAQKRNASWARSEEMRRLPLACLAGPFIVLSLFWAGWTARPTIHWIVPTLSGIPFGIGYLLLFMALLNYIVDAYEIFAASASAAASTSRSTFGAILPFATRPMYNRLGVAWACSLLGFLSLAMCLIPFMFIKYGDQIRARSTFCQYLLQKKKEEEAKGNRAHDEEEGQANS